MKKGDSLNHWHVHARFEHFVPASTSLVVARLLYRTAVNAGCRPDCRSPCVPVPRSPPGKNMSADRKAAFKQPPRHVIDTALFQEVRRIKVCCCETTLYSGSTYCACPWHTGVGGAETRATHPCCIRKCYSTHFLYLETGEACGERAPY
jgi:hypothetical protein